MYDFDSPTNASLAQHRSRTEIVKEDQEDGKHLRQTRQGILYDEASEYGYRSRSMIDRGAA